MRCLASAIVKLVPYLRMPRCRIPCSSFASRLSNARPILVPIPNSPARRAFRGTSGPLYNRQGRDERKLINARSTGKSDVCGRGSDDILSRLIIPPPKRFEARWSQAMATCSIRNLGKPLVRPRDMDQQNIGLSGSIEARNESAIVECVDQRGLILHRLEVHSSHLSTF